MKGVKASPQCDTEIDKRYINFNVRKHSPSVSSVLEAAFTVLVLSIFCIKPCEFIVLVKL